MHLLPFGTNKQVHRQNIKKQKPRNSNSEKKRSETGLEQFLQYKMNTQMQMLALTNQIKSMRPAKNIIQGRKASQNWSYCFPVSDFS